MTKCERRWLRWANALTIVTGVIYAFYRYAVSTSDAFAVANHPFEPVARNAHVLVAPALVFAIGLIWRSHALIHYKKKTQQKRFSGFGMMSCAAMMITSGYFIQVAVADETITLSVILHVAISAAWAMFYVVHEVVGISCRTKPNVP